MLKYSSFNGCARIYLVLMTSYNIAPTLSRSALTQHNTLPCSFDMRLLTADWEESPWHTFPVSRLLLTLLGTAVS